MLQTLKFSVSFTTGKKLEGEHTFEKGMSAITGPNESGKSFRLEMIRYVLFGTKALRASTATINKLNVSLGFTVNEVQYFVERTKTSANLFKEDKQIVTGTSPVNAEIIRILGYNMEVFDTTNACLQGKVEDLSNKKPTERRRMVDKVIGLDMIDTIVNEVTSELSTLRKTLETVQVLYNHNLTAPEKPAEITLTSLDYRQIIEGLNEKYREKFAIDANLKQLYCEPMELPVKPEGDEEELTQKSMELKTLLQNYMDADKVISNLKTQISLISTKQELSELQSYILNNVPLKWQKYKEYEAKRVEDPQCSLDNIKYLRRYFEQRDLQAKIYSLQQGQKVCCPECEAEFFLDQKELDNLKAQLDTKIDWDFWGNTANKLKVTHAGQLDKLEQKVNDFIAFSELQVIQRPDETYLGTNEEVQQLIDRQLHKQELEAQLQQLAVVDIKEIEKVQVDLVVCQKALQALTAYNKKLVEINFANNKYKEYVEYKQSVTSKLEDLEKVANSIKTTQELQTKAVSYESLLNQYKVQSEANAKVKDQMNELEVRIQELTNLRKALHELKPKVKQYLVPSLNRVASNLLSQMTSGARTKVHIDEEFNILIDDQPIDTLSGSGKAVSNLAIRIGLGTVLTNKVFSVFLADEIDASMDQDRVAYTAECLKNLTKTVGQIILVSHKKPDADHQIEL